MLEPELLRNLLGVGRYREIRARCFKSWHQRTLDIVIYGEDAINKFAAKTSMNEGLMCPHVRFLQDDNSWMQSLNCNDYKMYNRPNYWDHFIFVALKSHVHVHNPEMECDDNDIDQGFTKEGYWLFYVR
eukprot:TCONS_00064981-protein